MKSQIVGMLLTIGASVGIAVFLACEPIVEHRHGVRITPVAQRNAATGDDRRDAEAAVHFAGVSSCSAQACHGSIKARPYSPVWNNEFTTWIQHDKHAQAFAVLGNERSQSIAKILDIGDARKAQVCLDCHAPQAHRDATSGELTGVSDGVGCESCHSNGRSTAWIAEHTTYRWSTLNDRAALGFADTKNLFERTQRCVACHVGSPEQQVNHDLIAAGHPRLSFELGSFMHSMPTHWSPEKLNEHPAKQWVVGQAAAAAGAARLLAARAADDPAKYSAAESSHVWPEFSEYSCYACHHDLSGEEWRQIQRDNGALSVFDWGSWYVDGLNRLDEHAGNTLGIAFPQQELESLHTVMQGSALKPRDRQAVADAANNAAAALETYAERLSKLNGRDAQFVAAMQQALKSPAEELHSWDSAAQTYLALVALHEATANDGGGATEASLKQLYQSLLFTKSYDSPHQFDHAATLKMIDQLRQKLARP